MATATPSQSPPALTPSPRDVRRESPPSEDSSCSQYLPFVDQLLTHLKLLECFYYLRQQVEAKRGLFGINDNSTIAAGDGEIAQSHKLVREKRWSIYLTRAAERFEAWYEKVIMVNYGNQKEYKIHQARHGPEHLWPDLQETISQITVDMLPPIDVLMVWHAYMLNPRYYLEDCIRAGIGRLYKKGMPWCVLDIAINKTYRYEPGEGAKKSWEEATGLPWANEDEPLEKTLKCSEADCQNLLTVPWVVLEGDLGSGYGEKDFKVTCNQCQAVVTHANLRLAKFKRHAKAAYEDDIPMLGTVNYEENVHLYPNGVVIAMREKIASAKSMKQIKNAMEYAVENKVVKGKFVSSISGNPSKSERVQLRHMLQCYWESHFRFSMDVSTAVVRQSNFVEKMHDLAWYHSPASTKTMYRSIVKYDRFFSLIADYPALLSVPTLDVDLGWHTQQLRPYDYFKYSHNRTGRLINHDDKVDETNLSDGFGQTNQLYMKKYNEMYSECLCWYCEAARDEASNTWGAQTPSFYAQFYDQALVHPSLSSPDHNAHISAHNSCRTISMEDKKRKDHAMSLRDRLLSAQERAKRKRYPLPPSPRSPDSTSSSSESESRVKALDLAPYSTSAPFAMTSGMTVGLYRVNPLCMATHPGECGAGCVGGPSIGGCVGHIGTGGVGSGGASCAGSCGGGCAAD